MVKPTGANTDSQMKTMFTMRSLSIVFHNS
nr:MAG TPA: hypothetical protein [Caudoviricetes sp.]